MDALAGLIAGLGTIGWIVALAILGAALAVAWIGFIAWRFLKVLRH